MEGNRRVGIVGSRRRSTLTDRKIVLRLVDWLIDQEASRGRLVLVSGGCENGADSFAETAARINERQIVVFPIDKKGATSRWEFTERAYERNEKIARESEELFCLVSSDRTGGTENTISHAIKLGKRVFLVLENGDVYLSQDGQMPKTPCDPVARLLG